MSIKRQLIALINSSVILAILFAAFHGYRSSLTQLENVLDKELVSVATIIHDVVLASDHIPKKLQSDIVFQVIKDGDVISSSKNSPTQFIATSGEAFGVTSFFGERWRTYTANGKGLRVIVAQPIVSRIESAEGILFETIAPIIYVVPIISLLIYCIIRSSFSSLTALSNQIKHRTYNDLSEIKIGSVPSELSPVVSKLNNLLRRLDSAFQREKQLSANTAHELRTPVSVLKLTAHNIEQEFKNGSLKIELLDELSDNISRQAHVIEQIISLYRLNPEQFNEELVEVDLPSIIREVISNNFEQLDENKQSIELRGKSERVQGDYFALYTLFENIISNSVKYSGVGTFIKVTISSQVDMVRIDIEDSGIGVNQSQREKIFERFYRVINAETEVIGSGLGMSIAKHVVDLHQGSISCSNSELGGLKTSITIPLKRNGYTTNSFGAS